MCRSHPGHSQKGEKESLWIWELVIWELVSNSNCKICKLSFNFHLSFRNCSALAENQHYITCLSTFYRDGLVLKKAGRRIGGRAQALSTSLQALTKAYANSTPQFCILTWLAGWTQDVGWLGSRPHGHVPRRQGLCTLLRLAGGTVAGPAGPRPGPANTGQPFECCRRRVGATWWRRVGGRWPLRSCKGLPGCWAGRSVEQQRLERASSASKGCVRLLPSQWWSCGCPGTRWCWKLLHPVSLLVNGVIQWYSDTFKPARRRFRKLKTYWFLRDPRKSSGSTFKFEVLRHWSHFALQESRKLSFYVRGCLSLMNFEIKFQFWNEIEFEIKNLKESSPSESTNSCACAGKSMQGYKTLSFNPLLPQTQKPASGCCRLPVPVGHRY